MDTHLFGLKKFNDIYRVTKNFTKREKGDLLELFTYYLFKLDERLNKNLENIWLYNKIPNKILTELNLPSRDKGIDLLIKINSEYYSIQCKFRQNPNRRISWKQISTFVGLSFGLGDKIKGAFLVTNVCDVCKEIMKSPKINIINESFMNDLSKNFFDKMKNEIILDLIDELNNIEIENKIANDKILANDKTFGDLFYSCFSNKFVYDLDNKRWYSINEYGIFKNENDELITAKGIFSEDLVEYFQYYLKKKSEVCIESEDRNKYNCIASIFYNAISSVSKKKLGVEYLKEKFMIQNFQEKVNNNKYIFPFNNGVYDLKTFTFRNALFDEFVTVTCGINYKPNSPSKNEVMIMLHNIFIDLDIFTYTMKIFALRLVAINLLEEFYFLLGSGGNGKGLLTRLIENLFGNLSITLDDREFSKTRHGVHADAASPGLASTRNARVVFINELEKNLTLTVNFLKRVSGNDKLKVRFLRENFFEFYAMYALFFVSNKEPIIDGNDDGIIRRCRYIEFKTKFVDNPDPDDPYQRKIDRTLKQKINTDEFKCAFFDILVEFYKDFMTNDIDHLTPPECVIEKTRKYLEENDPLKQFLNETIKITSNEKDIIKSSDLYQSYITFHDNNSRGIDRQNFKKIIEQKYNIRTKRNNTGIVFIGMQLKQ